jgi:hypothetical protein
MRRRSVIHITDRDAGYVQRLQNARLLARQCGQGAASRDAITAAYSVYQGIRPAMG